MGLSLFTVCVCVCKCVSGICTMDSYSRFQFFPVLKAKIKHSVCVCVCEVEEKGGFVSHHIHPVLPTKLPPLLLGAAHHAPNPQLHLPSLPVSQPTSSQLTTVQTNTPPPPPVLHPPPCPYLSPPLTPAIAHAAEKEERHTSE